VTEQTGGSRHLCPRAHHIRRLDESQVGGRNTRWNKRSPGATTRVVREKQPGRRWGVELLSPTMALTLVSSPSVIAARLKAQDSRLERRRHARLQPSSQITIQFARIVSRA
jgi:hypothetical protein